jgi:hypothetical protein
MGFSYKNIMGCVFMQIQTITRIHSWNSWNSPNAALLIKRIYEMSWFAIGGSMRLAGWSDVCTVFRGRFVWSSDTGFHCLLK